MTVSPGGNVYTAFYTASPSSPGDSPASIIKYDTNGNRLWLSTFSQPPFGFNTPEAIGLDANENAYVLVGSFNATGPPVLQDNVSEIFKFNANGTHLASFGSDKLGPIIWQRDSASLGPFTIPYHFSVPG